MAFGVVGGFISKGKKEYAIMLALTGVFLFELLFEPRARHMLSVLPFFIYMASIGGYGSVMWIKTKISRLRTNK